MEADEKTTKDFLGNAEFINEAPARTLLEFLKYSPGKYFRRITTPIFVAACSKDDLAPADKTIVLAKKAKNATYKRYDCGHFQIYCNELFEEVISDYISFYNQAVQ